MSFYTASEIDTLSSGTVRVDLLMEMQFTSTTVYVWNGMHAFESGSRTWQPLKGQAQVGRIPSVNGGKSAALEVSLSGVPDQQPDFLRLALEETPEANQQKALLYLQLWDEALQPTGAPVPIFSGYMQPPRMSKLPSDEDTPPVETIRLKIENAFYNRSRPTFGRLTDSDQKSRHAGDQSIEFIAELVNKTFTYPDY
ncbi:MAG: hypothetical protein AAF468_12625 [Pseudomonadota bacterium]